MNSQSSKDLIHNILALPEAPLIVEEVRLILETEQKKRHQFYNHISEYEKAEFIQGEIVIHSPVREQHHDVSGALYQLLSVYVKRHKLGYVGHEKIMIALSRNDYEPDICFFNTEKAASFDPQQTLFPAPELVVEVLSQATAGNDRGVKFKDYQIHEIQEYWIIDAEKQLVEQYRLNEGKTYELVLKAGEGKIQCLAVKGFIIDIRAMFDEEVNLKELSKILE